VAGGNRYISRKRVYEQDLKVKVLGALCYIPDVTVEVNMEFNGERTSKGKQTNYNSRSAQQSNAAANMPQAAQGIARVGQPSTDRQSSNVATVLSAVLGDGTSPHDNDSQLHTTSSDVANVPAERENIDSMPMLAKVSVGIPDSYFKKIWEKRFLNEEGKSSKCPDQKILDRIRVERTAEIKKHVAQLLPPAEGIHDSTELVAVTTFDDLPVKELAGPTLEQSIFVWLKQYGGMLVLVGLALVSLWVLRSMARTGATEMQAASLLTATTTSTSNEEHFKSVTKHHVRHASPKDMVVHSELSEVIQQDPNAAANILRTWVGNSG